MRRPSLQTMPSPRNQEARSSAPTSHRSHGGIDSTTSSRSRRDQLGDVVALEGVDVVGQQLLLVGPDRGVERLVLGLGQGGPGPLQRAVDRGDAGVEQLGHLGGLPPQHLAEDEGRALAGRQPLEGGHERQADGLAGGGHVGRVAVEVDDPLVLHRLHEGVLAERLAQLGLGVGRGRAHLHRPRPALGAAVHVDAHVVGDAVEPRPQRRAALEPVDRAPGPHHRLLHGVFRLGTRAEHAVAEAGQLGAVRLQRPFEFLAAGGAGAGEGRGRHGDRC